MTAARQSQPQDPGHRPDEFLVVTGTGTEVGKTWLSARILGQLVRTGVRCAARKPAQSFDPAEASPRDADVLAGATGEDPEVVCPQHRNYRVAMAPPMAADVLGADRIGASVLLAEIDDSWPDPSAGFGLVELAGGVRSPIAHDADCAEFTAMLAPTRIVLVADAGLGTISAVLSALDSLAAAGAVVSGDRGEPDGAGAPATTVYLNRYDGSCELHRRNRAWLGASGCGTIPVTPAELVALIGPRQ